MRTVVKRLSVKTTNEPAASDSLLDVCTTCGYIWILPGCMRVDGVACVLHHLWVHARVYCTAYKKGWALAASDDIVHVLASFIMHVYTNEFAHVCTKNVLFALVPVDMWVHAFLWGF